MWHFFFFLLPFQSLIQFTPLGNDIVSCITYDLASIGVTVWMSKNILRFRFMKRVHIRECSEGVAFGRKRAGLSRRSCDAILVKGPTDPMVGLWSMG